MGLNSFLKRALPSLREREKNFIVYGQTKEIATEVMYSDDGLK